MSENKPAHDLFVSVARPDPSLVDPAQLQQGELEDLATRSERADSAFLMTMGENLFRLAFPTADAVGDFAVEFAGAVRANAVLRLWIHAKDPRVAMLPWEYLCLTKEAVEDCRANGVNIAKYQPHTNLPEESTFLALHPHVSLLRQSNPQPPAPELERLGALRVLVVWANPATDTWGAIKGIESEVASVHAALARLPSTHIERRVLEHTTRAELERALRDWRPHVLHYAGHGGFPELDDPGDMEAPSLVLEALDADGRRQHDYLTANDLRALCGACGVQVVVLNACWGGRTSPDFTGIAHALTTPGTGRAVPVVVAHQMPILQSAAAGFAVPFYQNLVLACPVEEGVRTFRADTVKAGAFGHGVPDWGIPVVFLGVRNSTLFRSERLDPYPLNFGAFIGLHVPIVGRRFVRDEIERFREKKTGGIFLLTAPPGAGKTAFLAQCADQPGFLAQGAEEDDGLVHFFYRATEGLTDPDDCVKSLYHGLLGRHRLLVENSTNDALEVRRRFEALLDQVSERCGRRGKPEFLLIDALDEAGQTALDRKSAVEVFPARIPPHVYVLVTSRPVPVADALAERRDVVRFDLDPSSDANLRDAADFSLRELQGRVTDWDETALGHLGTQMARQVAGNFLVLKLFLSRDSLGDRVSVADLERAAAGLTPEVEKEYEKFVARVTRRLQRKPKSLERFYRILGAFATARAPVTPEQVCTAMRLGLADWEAGFGLVSQFLERGGVRQEEHGALTYRIYHETFREFLSKKLAVELRKFHRRWAKYLLDWRDLSGYARLYALRYLSTHLIAASKQP